MVGGGAVEGIVSERDKGGSEKSSKGGTTEGLGTPLVVLGVTFFAELLMSGKRASSSRRSCFSYMIEERACSIKAVVKSSFACWL